MIPSWRCSDFSITPTKQNKTYRYENTYIFPVADRLCRSTLKKNQQKKTVSRTHCILLAMRLIDLSLVSMNTHGGWLVGVCVCGCGCATLFSLPDYTSTSSSVISLRIECLVEVDWHEMMPSKNHKIKHVVLLRVFILVQTNLAISP